MNYVSWATKKKCVARPSTTPFASYNKERYGWVKWLWINPSTREKYPLLSWSARSENCLQLQESRSTNKNRREWRLPDFDRCRWWCTVWSLKVEGCEQKVVPFASPKSVVNRRRRKKIATRKQVAIREVFATPKIVTTQKGKAIHLVGYQLHPRAGKTRGISSKQTIRKIPFDILGFPTSQTQPKVLTWSLLTDTDDGSRWLIRVILSRLWWLIAIY